jgi:hypothetical protein
MITMAGDASERPIASVTSLIVATSFLLGNITAVFVIASPVVSPTVPSAYGNDARNRERWRSTSRAWAMAGCSLKKDPHPGRGEQVGRSLALSQKGAGEFFDRPAILPGGASI